MCTRYMRNRRGLGCDAGENNINIDGWPAGRGECNRVIGGMRTVGAL